MTFLAIDPGPTHSAYVWLMGGKPQDFAKVRNDEMLSIVRPINCPVVIEQVVSYGKPVGAETFETVYWSGIFAHGAGLDNVHRITRPDVKMHLCHTTKGVTDAVIRQRLIDLFGGKEKAIGKKKAPGPLYGITKDCWAALALAVTFHERTLKAMATGADQ